MTTKQHRQSVFTRSVVLLAFVSALTLVACGGGGGGAADPTPAPSPTPTPTPEPTPTTGTFTKQFGIDGAGENGLPFSKDNDFKIQMLYYPGEVGGSGKITMLRLRTGIGGVPVTTTCPNFSVRMGHTNVTGLVKTFANNVKTGQGSLQTVMDDATLTIPVTASEHWFDIALTTPFEYNGVDNLVVEFENTTKCSNASNILIVNESAGTNRRAVSSDADATADADHSTTDANFADSTHYWAQFVFAGGDAVAVSGSAGGTESPLTTTVDKQRVQTLYLAAEIGGSGPITGMAMQVNTTTVAAQTYTYNITLGHTSLTELTATSFASNITGSSVKVASNVSFTVPAGLPAGAWFWVPMPDGLFSYDGTSNLVADITVTSASGSVATRVATDTAKRRASGANSSATPTVVDTVLLNARFRFNGGSTHVITSGGGSNDLIFNSPSSAAQLYPATMLGSGGTITGVSCRLQDAASVETDYNNFRVVIGHATAATLSGTPATDFVSQNTVFRGTVKVPAGLVQGDWIEIPLTTPFVYDGKSDLIVWLGTGVGLTAGTVAITQCHGELNSPRYFKLMGYAANGVGASSYIPDSWMTDMRMKIKK